MILSSASVNECPVSAGVCGDKRKGVGSWSWGYRLLSHLTWVLGYTDLGSLETPAWSAHFSGPLMVVFLIRLNAFPSGPWMQVHTLPGIPLVHRESTW